MYNNTDAFFCNIIHTFEILYTVKCNFFKGKKNLVERGVANTWQCLFWSLEKLFHVVVDHHKKVEIMIAFITMIKNRGESRSGTYCIGGTKDFYGEIRNELSSDARNRNCCSKGKLNNFFFLSFYANFFLIYIILRIFQIKIGKKRRKCWIIKPIFLAELPENPISNLCTRPITT